MALVRAIRTGYYADVLRNPGDIFEMDDSVFCPKDEGGNPYKRQTRNGRGQENATCKWAELVKPGQKVDLPPPAPARPPGAGPMPGTVSDKAAPTAEAVAAATAEETKAAL